MHFSECGANQLHISDNYIASIQIKSKFGEFSYILKRALQQKALWVDWNTAFSHPMAASVRILRDNLVFETDEMNLKNK